MTEQRLYNDEIDLREYLEVILKHWKLIISVTILVAMGTLGFSLLQKPVYEAKTTVLVRSGGGGNSNISQFAGLAGLAGISLPSGGSMGDITELIQSKAVAAKVLEDLKLRERIKGWDNPRIEDIQLAAAVSGMLKKPRVSGNIIELRVEYSDPKLAAEIVNCYVDALSYYLNKLNLTEARKKKDYIESQLPRVGNDLLAAERKMKRFTLLSARGASAQGIEVSRLAREQDIQNSIYIMLRKEYESVKLEESKEIPPFSVVDEAVAPKAPSKPKVKLNMMIGLVLGLFGGTFLAFFKEYWAKSGGS